MDLLVVMLIGTEDPWSPRVGSGRTATVGGIRGGADDGGEDTDGSGHVGVNMPLVLEALHCGHATGAGGLPFTATRVLLLVYPDRMRPER
jgi:hypothetical protein